MAKKQPSTQYIAIDSNHDRVIVVGPMDVVHSELQTYIEDGELEQDYVKENIIVFVLGDEKSVTIHPRIDITIGE